MTSADLMRFIIIISLGIVAFVTFLVAGTILGLMWLDSWSCYGCKRYPVGLWVLGVLGILYIISISYEASEAPEPWEKWVKAHWVVIAVVAFSIAGALLVINWWWI